MCSHAVQAYTTGDMNSRFQMAENSTRDCEWKYQQIVCWSVVIYYYMAIARSIDFALNIKYIHLQKIEHNFIYKKTYRW